MKKSNIYLVMMLLAMGCFIGCSKDDDEKEGSVNGNGNNTIENGDKFIVNAKVENGDALNSQIDSVKFFLNDQEIAKGKYSNGGFTLELPQKMDEKFLNQTIGNLVKDVGINNATISASDAKTTSWWGDDRTLEAYKSGVFVGDFDNEHGTTMAFFVYADRNVSVSGTNSEASLNISLKKGWNIVYGIVKVNYSNETFILTSQEPAGFKWVYTEYEK